MDNLPRTKSQPPSGISLSALAIGVILVVVNSYWISANDYLKGLNHTYMSLFSNAVFTLFVLILLNLLCKKIVGKAAFKNTDLLVIYVMVVMVSTISGHRMTRLLGPIAHPYWYATAENDWRNLFWHYIPGWFTVENENDLRGFFLGEDTFFTLQHIKAWIEPLFYWSAFLFVLCFILICINAIIKRQFSEHERLTYPITWLPLEMGRDPVGFLKNRLMWVGFGIAAGISLFNGLKAFYPFVPYIPVGWTQFHFQEKPWELHARDAHLFPAVCHWTLLFYAAGSRLFGLVLLLFQENDAIVAGRHNGMARTLSRRAGSGSVDWLGASSAVGWTETSQARFYADIHRKGRNR